MGDFKRPAGDITTLLDITDRDVQDNDLFPLDTLTTWFTRSADRRNVPFVPVVQDFPFRGPASYGQRFSFDIGSLPCGDMMLGTAVQITLSHWFDLTTQVLISSKKLTYDNPSDAFFFANSSRVCCASLLPQPVPCLLKPGGLRNGLAGAGV